MKKPRKEPWNPFSGKAKYRCSDEEAIEIFQAAMKRLRGPTCHKNYVTTQYKSTSLCSALASASQSVTGNNYEISSNEVFGETWAQRIKIYECGSFWLPPMPAYDPPCKEEKEAYTARVMLLEWLILECEEAIAQAKKSAVV